MPVPVSVTNPKGVGLGAASPSELPTSGPFARLGSQAASGQAPQLEPSGDRVDGVAGRGAAAAAAGGLPEAASAPCLDDCSIVTQGLNFHYPGIDGRPVPGSAPVVQDMSIRLPKGATCLLIGPNGAGKTTLLKARRAVLAGKHMVPKGAVQVLGQPPFHAVHLTTSGALSYVGGNWERDVAFAGYSVPLAGDIPASQMLSSIPGVDPARRETLIEALDIDPTWRMHLVSDGQRRRVQIAMGLLKPFQVLLLDEITVDLDVLGRADLMAFLQQECRERGATIVYATHIFDGLESWPSHVMYLARGRLQLFQPAAALPELKEGRLLELVERWLRTEKEERQARHETEAAQAEGGRAGDDKLSLASWNNGWAAGRLSASIKLSSNAVMRM
ncbi:hypothetical protein N2152v2_011220 [Parachlorella kessleri]